MSETASGTGIFNAYLAVSDVNSGGDSDDAAIGYNVGPTLVMPEVDASKTEYMRVGPGSFGGDVILTQPDATSGQGSAVSFYAFGLDINEPSTTAGKYLSVDKVEIYVSPNQLANGTTKANLLALGGGATKVYDMDIHAGGNSSILLDYTISGAGSGRADMALLVPKSNFDAVSGINANWYVYFYTEVGATGTGAPGQPTRDYGENAGGFEEWGTLKGFTFFIPPLVPEAGTWGAIGATSAAAAAAYLRARRPRKKLS